jgi:serine/threonine protein kinase
MLTSDLGACEWFVWDLRRSNLIEREKLDQVIGEFLGKNPGAEPPALAEYLKNHNVLTEFQAERLLQGKTQGFVLGPFTLMDALGSGSMGTVYKAQSKTDNKYYAVKMLPRRSMWNVRIARRKVRLFEQCQHPTVVPFVDVGTAGGMHYLAWPLVEGETLDKIVPKEGKLTPEQTVQYALQTAEGLALCHQQGLFHGLLKPSNLMVSPEGQIRILDFGIGCLLAETEGESLVDTMSTANSVNSGLDCSSPESIMDPTNLTPIGDQYSLGCVMYYCLTGQYPFPDGTAVEKMMAHQHKQPAPIKALAPDTPDGLITVVERLMHKSPASRYSGCAEVIEALRPFAPTIAVRNRPAQSIPRPKAPPAPAQPVASTVPAARETAPRLTPRHASPLPPRAPSTHIAVPSLRAAPAVRPMPPPATSAPAPKPAYPIAQVAPPAPAPQPANPPLGTLGTVLVAVLAAAVSWLLASLVMLPK